jgi:hypothetical protein
MYAVYNGVSLPTPRYKSDVRNGLILLFVSRVLYLVYDTVLAYKIDGAH